MSSPQIKIVESLDAEVQIFADFLHHKDFPQHRFMIFVAYPELEIRLKGLDSQAEKEELRKFILEFRNKYQSEAEKATNYIKNQIESKGSQSLEILAQLMDYKWPTTDDYQLQPTIFPSCPFNKRRFYFSIIGIRKGKTEYEDVLPVAMHEISHFIFFDIIKEKNIKLGRELLYFVKEIIAPIIVYQDDFAPVFKKQIIGNLNVMEIYVSDNGRVIKAFDYFNTKFIENRKSGNDFRVFLEDMIVICRIVEKEIMAKHQFWDKHGNRIKTDPELMKMFREPIMLR